MHFGHITLVYTRTDIEFSSSACACNKKDHLSYLSITVSSAVAPFQLHLPLASDDVIETVSRPWAGNVDLHHSMPRLVRTYAYACT